MSILVSFKLTVCASLCYLNSVIDVVYWYVFKCQIRLNIQFYAYNELSKCHTNVRVSSIGHGYVKQNEESK